MGRVSKPVLHRRQGEEGILVRADEPETRQFDDLRRPVVQHAAESRRSRGRTNTDDRQVATALVTVELKEDRIAGFTVDLDLRLRTGRAAWPSFAWFETRSLVGCWLPESTPRSASFHPAFREGGAHCTNR